MIQASHSMRRLAGVFAAALLLGAPAAPAWAGSACQGTYMASVMQKTPLPMPITYVAAEGNAKLGEAFVNGLRDAGGVIDPASRLRLALVFTVATPASGPMQGRVYNNFSWADEKGSFQDVSASVINLTGQVMDINSFAYVWIVSAQCTVKVSDTSAVAGELGALIGRSLGRDVQDGKF